MGRIAEGSEAKGVSSPNSTILIILTHLFTIPVIATKHSFIIIYMNVKLLAFNRLEIFFPSHYPTCSWSSLIYLPVFTGLHLPFMSSLTFSDFTNCCQERGWSFSNVNHITGEDLEISGETALLQILSIHRGAGELHLFAEIFVSFFSLWTIKLERKEPNNPTGNKDECLRVDLK